MSVRRGFPGLLIGLMLMAPTAAVEIPPQTTSSAILPIASAEVEMFVRDALRDRLIAGDIPDIQLVRAADAKRFYVRAEVPASRVRITSRALPSMPDTELALLTLAEAQETATRSGRGVFFIAVEHVRVEESKGTIWLGAGLEVPPGQIKSCCCEREALFERRDGQLSFQRWGIGGRCY